MCQPTAHLETSLPGACTDAHLWLQLYLFHLFLHPTKLPGWWTCFLFLLSLRNTRETHSPRERNTNCRLNAGRPALHFNEFQHGMQLLVLPGCLRSMSPDSLGMWSPAESILADYRRPSTDELRRSPTTLDHLRRPSTTVDNLRLTTFDRWASTICGDPRQPSTTFDDL